MESCIEILLCFDRRFLPGAAVTIRSISENAEPSRPLRFHIVHPDLRPRDRKTLDASAMDRAAGVRSVYYPLDLAVFDGLLRSRSVSRTAYARILAGEVLDAVIHRVVYVDVDVLFLRDVAELFDLPLGNHVLAAVPNGSLQDQREQIARLGLASRSYFASGLMVINLDLWRTSNLGARALHFAERAGSRLVLHDQDALNAILAGEYLQLPLKWCHLPSYGRTQEPVVVHYAMDHKPWHADYTGDYRDEFFQHLDRTALAGWRPARWMGLAPHVARLSRMFPYAPTALRLLTERASRIVGRVH